MINFRLQRDAKGRPAAIRIQVHGINLRALGRSVRGQIPGMPKRIIGVAGALATGVRAAIPQFVLRRDVEGRPQAVVLLFGAYAEGGDGTGGRLESFRAGLQTFQRWLSAAVTPYVPHLILQRDTWGRAVAIRVRLGSQVAVGAGTASNDLDVWVIEPVGSGALSRIQEFWRYRRILKYLAVQSVQRMYVGMTVGMAWLFVRPLLPIFISTVIFGTLLNVPSDNVPYFLFFLTGTMNWMLFERSLLWATRSLDQQRGMMRKMYFPRLLVPVSSVAPALVDALIYSGLLLGAIFYYQLHDGRWYLRVGPSLLVSALAAFLAVVLAIAVGLWTSVWQVRAREVRYTLRYVVRFWNYLTPVLYPLSQVPEEYRWVVFLNPMAPLVEAFKWGVLGLGELNLRALGSAIVVIALTLMSGIWYFTHAEAATVDS